MRWTMRSTSQWVAVLFKEAQVTAAEGHSYRVARRDKALDQLANAAIKAVDEKVPCAREPISRQLFGPYSGCVTCRASK